MGNLAILKTYVPSAFEELVCVEDFSDCSYKTFAVYLKGEYDRRINVLKENNENLFKVIVTAKSPQKDGGDLSFNKFFRLSNNETLIYNDVIKLYEQSDLTIIKIDVQKC